MSKFSAVLVTLILINLTACSDSADKQSLNDISFHYNEALLSDNVNSVVLGVDFRTPNELGPLDEQSMDQFVAQMSANNHAAGFDIQPQYVFVDSAFSFILMINAISFDSDEQNVALLKTNYNQYLQEQLKDRVLKHGDFVKDGLKMTQYVITDGTTTNLKLFFENNNRLVQFDYIVRAGYEDRISSIESSIGSIHTTNRGE